MVPFPLTEAIRRVISISEMRSPDARDDWWLSVDGAGARFLHAMAPPPLLLVRPRTPVLALPPLLCASLLQRSLMPAMTPPRHLLAHTSPLPILHTSLLHRSRLR